MSPRFTYFKIYRFVLEKAICETSCHEKLLDFYFVHIYYLCRLLVIPFDKIFIYIYIYIYIYILYILLYILYIYDICILYILLLLSLLLLLLLLLDCITKAHK